MLSYCPNTGIWTKYMARLFSWLFTLLFTSLMSEVSLGRCLPTI
jgi:hypothetical protein